MKKKLYIMRGLPGSGKSTRAHEIAMGAMVQGAQGAVICSTDDFFVGSDGVYRFDGRRLGEAHSSNQSRVELAMMADTEVVIVDNTNTTHKEMEAYRRLAQDYSYEVTEIMVGGEMLFPGLDGNPHLFADYIDMCARRNTHGVPRVNIERMARRFEK
jgi:hypothetical protein